VLERPTICRSGAPTQDGSKSLSMKKINSSTGLTARFLMLLDPKMKKVKLLELPEIQVRLIKNGKFSISTRQKQLKLKDSMKNLVSILTDHSILDPDFQCRD
jgi:hypothetical protein